MEWTRDGKMCRQAFFLKLAVVAWAWILFFICLKEKFIFSKVDLSLNILGFIWFISVTQLCPTLCDPEPQHTRPPCPSPTPGVYLNSCPLTQWCHPIISSSVVPFSSRPQSFPASGFSNELALCIRWPKYWSFSFSISPSKEYSGLISFRIDWLDLLDWTWAPCIEISES